MNDQASRSCDTFADEITEPGATLVLARLPFGYGHCPEGAVAPKKVMVAGVVFLPPAPAGASMVTAASRAAASDKRAPRSARLVNPALPRFAARPNGVRRPRPWVAQPSKLFTPPEVELLGVTRAARASTALTSEPAGYWAGP